MARDCWPFTTTNPTALRLEHAPPAARPDGSVRTHNPERADLFLVPLFSALGASNTDGARSHVELVLRHLRTVHPYWDRRGGCDHVLFLTGDRGGCELGSVGVSPIIVSHFGLLGPAARMGALGTFRGELDDEAAVVAEVATGRWCYAPHKVGSSPPEEQGDFHTSLLVSQPHTLVAF